MTLFESYRHLRLLRKEAYRTALLLCLMGSISLANDSAAGSDSLKAKQAAASAKATGQWAFLNPQDESRYVRLAAGQASSFQLINSSSHKLNAYMLNSQGIRQHYMDLPTGETKSQGTYSNQVWVITDENGQVRTMFLSGPTASAIEVSNTDFKFRRVTSGAATIAATAPLTNNGAGSSSLGNAGSKGSESTAQISSNKSAAAEPPNISDLSSLPDEDSIPFTKNSNGHLVVKAELNGRPLEMLFDTGASSCTLGTNHLKSAGIDPATLKGQTKMTMGSSGRAVGVTVVAMNLKLGKTTRKVDIWVQGDSPTPPLVGENFLSGLQYEINNQLHVIRLKKSTNISGKASAERFDPRDRNAVPFTMLGKSIIVPVEVCGKQVPMIFDTGAHAIAIPMRTWLDLKVPAKLIGRSMSMGIDGATPNLVYEVDRVDFGPVALKNVKIYVSNPGPPMALLGESVLGEEKFIIDNSKNIIRFHR